MRLRLSSYLIASIAACCIVVGFIDVRVLPAYALAAAAIALPLFLPSPPRLRWVLLVSTGGLWLVYLIRPIVHLLGWAKFVYPFLSYVDHWRIQDTLYTIALLGLGFQLTFWAALWWILPPEPGPAREPARPWLLRAPRTLLLIGVGLVALRLLLLIGFRVGQKGGDAGGLGALMYLIPEDLLFALPLLYLLRYRHRVDRAQLLGALAVLALISGAILLEGSKAFAARLMLGVFVYLLVTRGDQRLPFARFVALALPTAFVLLASFSIATATRLSVATQGGIGRDAVAELVGRIAAWDLRTQAIVASDMFTKRLAGYDGMLAVGARRDPIAQEIFTPGVTAQNVVSKLLPGVRPGRMTQGKAISVYYTRFDESHGHGGALGLFGAARLAAGPAALLLVMTIAAAMALVFRIIDLCTPDVRYVLAFIATYDFLRWVTSGNFDGLLTEMAIQAGQLVFYAAAAWLVWHVAAVRTERTPVIA